MFNFYSTFVNIILYSDDKYVSKICRDAQIGRLYLFLNSLAAIHNSLYISSLSDLINGSFRNS